MMNFSKILLASAAILFAGSQASALTFKSADPASGSTLSEIKTVTLTYEGLQEGYTLEVDTYNGYVLYSFNNSDVSSIPMAGLNPEISGSSITVTLPEAITTEGSYAIYVPAGVVYGVNADNNYDDAATVGTIEDGEYAGSDYSAKLEYTVGQDPIVVTKAAQDLNNLVAGTPIQLTFDLTNNTDAAISNVEVQLYYQGPYDAAMSEWSLATPAVSVAAGMSGEFSVGATLSRCPGNWKGQIKILKVNDVALETPAVADFTYSIVDGDITSEPANGSITAPLSQFKIKFPALEGATGMVMNTSSSKRPAYKRYPVGGGTAKTVTETWDAANYTTDGFTATINLPAPFEEEGLYYANIKKGFYKYNDEANTEVPMVFFYFYIDPSAASITPLATEIGEPVYYDLQGRRVINPTHGIYIKKLGNKTFKIAL